MKRSLLIFGLILMVLLSLSFISAIDPIYPSGEVVKSCSFDSDCVLVENRDLSNSPCSCLDSVNNNYVSEYEEVDFGNPLVVECEPCPPSEDALAVCSENVCEVSYSGEISPNYPSGDGKESYIDSALPLIIVVILVVIGIILSIYFLVRRIMK